MKKLIAPAIAVACIACAPSAHAFTFSLANIGKSLQSAASKLHNAVKPMVLYDFRLPPDYIHYRSKYEEMASQMCRVAVKHHQSYIIRIAPDRASFYQAVLSSCSKQATAAGGGNALQAKFEMPKITRNAPAEHVEIYRKGI